VAVVGETGVGKGVVARLLHAQSGRGGRFVRVAAPQLDTNLFRSQLLGHAAGAFTGARAYHCGLAEQANGGTLFLDELQDAGPEVQAVLLDLFDGEAIRPLGAEREIQPDARILVASQEPLDALVVQQKLRPDLRQRVGWVEIRIPPLRERREDLKELAHHFAGQVAEVERVPLPMCTAALREAMYAYPWPGNVRELAAVTEHVVLYSAGDVAGLEALPEALFLRSDVSSGPARKDRSGRDTLGALRQSVGNVTKAARMLGVSAKTVRRDLKKRGVCPDELRAASKAG
jgi:DNA-binding NtrC family response regulator